MNDKINHPAHYQGEVECIDCIKSAVRGLEGIEAYCAGNALKYIYRHRLKGGIEDLQKATWYIERLISEYENDDEQKWGKKSY